MSLHIPESTVQAAFDYLRDSIHAKSRAAYEFSDRQLKVVLAAAAKKSNAKTVAEREADALVSLDYAAALEAHQSVSEAYFTARDKREAAVAIIDGWRTQQSDQRASGRVAA